MAASLAAQTLSFGEISLIAPATAQAAAPGACPTTTAPVPPCYSVNLVLSTAGAQMAGLQFDLNYDPNSLNVTIGLGAQATKASMDLNLVCLGVAIASCTTPQAPTPASFNPSTKVAQNNGPGQRAIIIGCCTGTQTTPTSIPVADGVAAILYVQATANPTAFTLTLPTAVNYMAATSPGGTNQAATQLSLTVGPGSNDPNATGILDLSKSYLVGDVYPFTADTLGHFGSGALNVLDVVQVLFTSVSLITPPTACSDRFDAMDSAPVDTSTTRGGDGLINVLDVVETLFRSVNLDKTTPERTSRGGVCAASQLTSNLRTDLRVARPRVENYGTLQFGPVEPTANGGQRVPVSLLVTRDVPRVALALGVGDQQSQLHFVRAGVAPSLVQDGQVGVLALGWLDGLNVRAGENVLLGYVAGPAGYAANLKVSGVSAAGLNDGGELGVDVSGVPVVQK
jgi:hypothetical protein